MTAYRPRNPLALFNQNYNLCPGIYQPILHSNQPKTSGITCRYKVTLLPVCTNQRQGGEDGKAAILQAALRATRSLRHF